MTAIPSPLDPRNLEFLFEIGSQRNVSRTWQQFLGSRTANNLEHGYRVMWLALLIARGEGVQSDEKILKMALMHDLSETRTGDQNYMHKIYTKADEHLAFAHLFAGTIFADESQALIAEYEARQSIEAKIVKDADNLDIDVEMKELAEAGSQLPTKWKSIRQLIRDEKLYTNTAKQLWDVLQTVDVADWHIRANKFLTMPGAGR